MEGASSAAPTAVSDSLAARFVIESVHVYSISHVPTVARVSDDHSLSVVMGNLINESREKHYLSWMSNKIQSSCQVSPTSIYVRSQFRGMLWTAFTPQTQRYLVVES